MSGARREQCRKCKGAGLVGKKRELCATCKGSGAVLVDSKGNITPATEDLADDAVRDDQVAADALTSGRRPA